MNVQKIALIAVSGLLLTTTSGLAYVKGLYIGAQVGGSKASGNHEFRTPGNQDKESLKAIGGLGGIVAGYVQEIGTSRMVVGGEVYFNGHFSSDKIKLKTGGVIRGDGTVKHTSSMGAAVMGGMLINPKLLGYARIGFESAKFSFNYTNPADDVSKSTTAIVPGAGASWQYSERVCIGGEYQYASFKKITPRNIGDKGIQRGFTVKPTEHRVLVKLTYNFWLT